MGTPLCGSVQWSVAADSFGVHVGSLINQVLDDRNIAVLVDCPV